MNDPQLQTAADDISARILRLIENAHGADDLAPDSVERVTGIHVEHDPKDSRVYGFGAHMDKDWCYNLMSLPDDEDSQSRRLIFSFDDQTGHSLPPPVGELDYDAYARALGASGYAGSLRVGPRGAFDGFTFKRGKVSVSVSVRGNEADPLHLRVSSLIIDAR
ncbi:hypothetical protein [Luteimonas panaciterrae]|uniref:hypothetical protein n=1 Tax=Luteimonas panaciterrae TaxID=363885 RepID=UPI001CFBB461|nr:hypothetical protein [Luteimonas panaciterrae]